MGAVGELAAAIATILTLLYLARQIQLGSKTIEAANLSTMIDATSASHVTGAQLGDCMEAAQSGSRELTEQEVWLLHIHCVQMFQIFETVFLFHLYGTVDQEYFDARARTVNRLGTFPYFRRWFLEYGKDLFDQRFVAYVEELWAEQSAVQTSFALPETSVGDHAGR